jgi:hypothetical protein
MYSPLKNNYFLQNFQFRQVVIVVSYSILNIINHCADGCEYNIDSDQNHC